MSNHSLTVCFVCLSASCMALSATAARWSLWTTSPSTSWSAGTARAARARLRNDSKYAALIVTATDKRRLRAATAAVLATYSTYHMETTRIVKYNDTYTLARTL